MQQNKTIKMDEKIGIDDYRKFLDHQVKIISNRTIYRKK